MNKKWIFIGVGIVTVLLLTVLIVTLVVVLRPEEWILLEKTFASEDEWCTPDWTLSSDRHRRRCRVPLICEPRRDGVRGNFLWYSPHDEIPFLRYSGGREQVTVVVKSAIEYL